MISRPVCYVDVLPAILEHSLLLTKYLYHYCQMRIPIPLDSCLIYLSSIAFPPITSISPLSAHLHIRQLPHPSRQLTILWFLLQLSPRILGWVAYPFFSGSSWPRNWTRISCIAGRFFTSWATREAPHPPHGPWISTKAGVCMFCVLLCYHT